MSDFIEISIIDDVLDEKYWSITMPRKHMTGHMYRNSPYETDDTCGNCDGARCDFCHEVTEPSHPECGITVDVLEALLKKHGVPEEDARNIVYDDYGRNKSGNYIFHFPDDWELKEKHEEFYNKLLEKDEELWSEFDFYKNQRLNPYKEVKNKRGLDLFSHDNHIDNQWRLWKGDNE